MSNTLDFEKPILELENKVQELEKLALENMVDLSDEFAGPIHIDSSAICTCKESLSISENTATVAIPNSLHDLIILRAISPLFAMSIFLNIDLVTS